MSDKNLDSKQNDAEIEDATGNQGQQSAQVPTEGPTPNEEATSKEVEANERL